MLTTYEIAAALALMSMATNKTVMAKIDREIRQVIPHIQPGDLAALWRETGERQLDEADAQERFAHMRAARG